MKSIALATIASASAVVLVTGCDVLMPGEDETLATVEPATPAPPAAPEPSPEALATDFDSWTVVGEPEVQPESVMAPDGTMSADRLVLDAGEGVAKMIASEGSHVSVAVTLWSDVEQSVALQLVDWCATESAQLETLPLISTSQPETHELSMTFERADACPRFQIIKMDKAGEISAWNTQITNGS